jgi:hypothetical protein
VHHMRHGRNGQAGGQIHALIIGQSLRASGTGPRLSMDTAPFASYRAGHAGLLGLALQCRPKGSSPNPPPSRHLHGQKAGPAMAHCAALHEPPLHGACESWIRSCCRLPLSWAPARRR